MVVSETHQRSTLTNSKFPNPLILKRGSCDAPGAACEEGGRDGRAAISDLLEATVATLPARSSGRALECRCAACHGQLFLGSSGPTASGLRADEECWPASVQTVGLVSNRKRKPTEAEAKTALRK